MNNDGTPLPLAEASAPKKLKLTLKLGNTNTFNNNSSSLPSSTSTSATNSNINSSTTVSPVKAPASASTNESVNLIPPQLIDLPSGLGNLKGRGRPKKPSATTATLSTNEPIEHSTSTSSATTNVSNTSNDYALELKSFVAAMKTFKPRSWSLKRPVSLDFKNVAGYEISLPAGMWCTSTSELASFHLRTDAFEDSALSTAVFAASMNSSVAAVFEAKCQCGKVFKDRSKYRKHVKIHDKPEGKAEAVIEATVVPTTVPTISLKLKLTNNQ